MTNPASWSVAADPNRRVGHSIEFHPSIGSTNDRAWELVRAGKSGIAVVADLQTSGRGRHGRTWSSPAGTNLMVSVALRLDLPIGAAWQLGAAAALALREACRSAVARVVGAGFALRWPNDVVDGGGKKLAGLLVETSVLGERVDEAVIGAGVNVNWRRSEMPAEIADRATSLVELRGAEVDRMGLLRVYLAALDAEIAGVEAGVSPLERFRAASWLNERRVRVAVGDRIVAGTVVGIETDGSLVLETDAGRVAVGYGEVVRVGVGLPDEVPA